MNKTAKLALGAATLWPFVYIPIFVGFFFSTLFSMSHDTSHGHASATMPTAIFALFAVHFATMLEIFALLIFYVVDAFRSPHIAADQRILWAILFFVGGPIGMAVYWYLNIWRTPPAVAVTVAQRPTEQG